ncbi:hypothetical protein HZS_3725, partial [Henneguya salminicola]
GRRKFPKHYICQYCFQLPYESLICVPEYKKNYDFECKYNCKPKPGILCTGYKNFSMVLPYHSQYKNYNKIKALVLNVLFGFMGADQFYLGNYGYGYFKLWTCGGFWIGNFIDMLKIYYITYAVPI